MVMAAGLGVPSAVAAGEAQNKNSCDAVGGTFISSGATKTCTVVDDESYTYTKDAGKSGRSWTFDYDSVTTTTYTRVNNDESMDVDVDTSTTCINPGGQEITEDLPEHCQLP